MEDSKLQMEHDVIDPEAQQCEHRGKGHPAGAPSPDNLPFARGNRRSSRARKLAFAALAALAVRTCFSATSQWQDIQTLTTHWAYQAYAPFQLAEGTKENVVLCVKDFRLCLPLTSQAWLGAFYCRRLPRGSLGLEYSRAFATHPHLAGSKEDFEDAKVMLKHFQRHFGIQKPSELPLYSAGSSESRAATVNIHELTEPTAWIDEYYPVMNTGKEVGLEILGDDGKPMWTADLLEDGDPRDPEAAKYRDAIPSWHGLSADGEAVGELIYVNYGTKDDYDNLLSVGTNFTGKIVLARYGANFRGLKVDC